MMRVLPAASGWTTITALTPADPHDQTPELWQRVAGQGWDDPNRRDAVGIALREGAIRRLAGALQPGPDAGPLVAAGEADENDDYWYGSSSLARCLGLDTDAAKVVSWLIALKVSTGENESSRFHAVSAAAAEFAQTQPHQLDGATDAFYRAHSELLTAFVAAQYAATQDMLKGLDSVVLHRGAWSRASHRPAPATPSYGRWRRLPSTSSPRATSLNARRAARAVCPSSTAPSFP